MSDRVHIENPDERREWIEGRRDRLALAREAGWGHVSWPSVAAGVFAAYGAFAVCLGILAAVLHPLGVNANDLTTNDWKRLGLGAGVVLAVVLLGSYAFGGYTAGRMARRAGLRHGVLVFAIGVAVLVVVAGIAQLEQATSAVRDRLESLGAPTGTSTWLGVGSLTGVIALVGMLVGSLLGGVRGERWHQRLIARALDPDVGPDADLRAAVELQRMAAEKAEARARRAGALPATDGSPAEREPAETEPARAATRGGHEGHDQVDEDGEQERQAEGGRGEPEPTGVGRPMRPSS